MFRSERRNEIMSLIRRDGRVTVTSLARQYGISEDSIRKDLQELARQGLCKRVYGGAVLPDGEEPESDIQDDSYSNVQINSQGAAYATVPREIPHTPSLHDRISQLRHARSIYPVNVSQNNTASPRSDTQSKESLESCANTVPTSESSQVPAASQQHFSAQSAFLQTPSFDSASEQALAEPSKEDLGRMAVARRAYYEINDGDTVFLDISRTNIYIAQLIAAGNKRVIVTSNMLDVLRILSNLPHVTALGTGGFLNSELNGFVGSATISLIEPLLFSKAFIGASGINLKQNAVTSNDIDSGATKEHIIQKASYKFLLADAEKFNYSSAYRFASINDFSAVITDSTDPHVFARLRRLAVPVLRAGS